MNRSKANYNDVYVPRDSKGVGRLAIAGKETALKLSTPVPQPSFTTDIPDIRDHHGTLNDGSKASLLLCSPKKMTTFSWGDGAQRDTTFVPRYVLTGRSFISSEESAIQAIHYHFENVDCLANEHRTFGTIRPDREEFRRILEAERKREEKRAKDYQWETRGLDHEIGEAPIVQYFNGVWEVVKSEARIGTVTLTNCASHGIGDSKGVRIDNEVTVSLEFTTPTTVDGALASLRTVHDFFELCLGRRQRFIWIQAELVKEEGDADNPVPSLLDVYWSYGNEGITGETEPTLFLDLLVDGGRQKEEFAKVLSGWLDSTESMRNARSRIANSFHSGSYDVNRIVGSANAFDLLPDTHVPSRVEPDRQTKEAVEECKKQFRALPESFARQSVLSALGRVGTPSLRDKICHRADIVTHGDPTRFSELQLPCRQAVLCRNHFVHGSERAFDYWKETGAFVFLVDTLEFVFAVSDLIELGWDYKVWCGTGFSHTHSFASYNVNYEMNVRRLKELIGA